MPVEDWRGFILFPRKVVGLVFGRDVITMHDSDYGEELTSERRLQMIVSGKVSKGGGEVGTG
jgi:hypothetical protein